jgi:hypothetical protein
MPLHVYECPKGHTVEILESIDRDSTGLLCGTQLHNKCRERLVLSAAVSTAPPKFKRGGAGGFYKPSSE